MNGCPHTGRSAAGHVCSHLFGKRDLDCIKRFTGVAQTYELLCRECSQQPDSTQPILVPVCSECFRAVEHDCFSVAILGNPEVLVATRNDLRFEHETVDLPESADHSILDIQPIERSAGVWLGCTSTGLLLLIDPPNRTVRTVAQLHPDSLDFDGAFIRETPSSWTKGPRCMLRVSPDGELAAVANTYGQRGVVLDLSTGKVTMPLYRDSYHEDVSSFPLALSDQDGRPVVIHGTEWNRLDVSDARTGVLLSQRQPTSYKQGEERPAHYLDYFHTQLSVSPGQQFVADNGWVWHPVGVVTTWSLPRWLHENVWESENGASKKSLCSRAYYWDGPLCWIDDQRLAVWGYGDDEERLIPAARIFNVLTGEEERWFAGPKGSLSYDEFLFSFDPMEGMSVWDITTGQRILCESNFCPTGYHRKNRHFLSLLERGVIRVSRLVQE